MPQTFGQIQTEEDGADSADEISFNSTNPDHPGLAKPTEPQWKQALRNITIEPVLFFHMFGFFSLVVIVQNLYIERICTVSFGYSQQQCQNISEELSKDEREKIDALASEYLLYRGLIETIIPIMFAVFLGSWTDKHGSKFSLLLPIFGCVLSVASYTMFTFLPNASPGYILLSSVPISLTGGMVAIVLSAFSFISAVTTNENRSFRIGVLETCWFAGMPLGLLTGAWIFKQLGFAPVFMNAGIFFGIALFYGIVFVQEDLMDVPSEDSGYFNDFFNVKAVKDTFWTVFSPREGPRRLWILLSIASSCLRILTQYGPRPITYLFVRYQFGWTEQEYSVQATVDMILQVVGGVIMTVLFVKMWKFSDSVIGLLSCVGVVLANVIVSAAPHGSEYGWMMYLASCVQMFGGMTVIVVRSMMSKIVPKTELAKIFTFVACGEAAMPLLANPLYSLTFINSEGTFPGAFSLLSAGINFLILCQFIYFCFSMRRNPEIMELEEEVDGVIN